MNGVPRENIFVARRRLWELKNLVFFLADKDGAMVDAGARERERDAADIYLRI